MKIFIRFLLGLFAAVCFLATSFFVVNYAMEEEEIFEAENSLSLINLELKKIDFLGIENPKYLNREEFFDNNFDKIYIDGNSYVGGVVLIWGGKQNQNENFSYTTQTYELPIIKKLRDFKIINEKGKLQLIIQTVPIWSNVFLVELGLLFLFLFIFWVLDRLFMRFLRLNSR